jgi:3-phosphoshikimate 1-carboxyvinyltransferase
MKANGTEELIDIHHAGTAMRFLAYYCGEVQRNRAVTLAGIRSRMQERPVKILVEQARTIKVLRFTLN